MSSLVAVELTRYRSRRSIQVIALVAVLVGAAFAFITAFGSRPYSPAEIADARAQAQIAGQDEEIRIQLATCRRDPTSYLGRAGTRTACAQAILPGPGEFLDREPLRIRAVIRDTGVHGALLVVALLMFAAATFAGADYTSGSIVPQLLAEPRRARVWWAKAGAVALASLTVAAVALICFWVPLLVVAAGRGLPGAGPEVGWHVVRVLLFTVAATVSAYALTTLVRHTSTAVGLVLAVTIGAEIVLGLVPLPGNGWLSPGHNVFAWLLGSTDYLDPSLRCPGADCDKLRTLDMWPAGGLMLAVALALFIASSLRFGRRDAP